MPMIDVYAVVGTLGDRHGRAIELGRTLVAIESGQSEEPSAWLRWHQ